MVPVCIIFIRDSDGSNKNLIASVLSLSLSLPLSLSVCVCVRVCLFKQLIITTKSGPVIYSFYATACNPHGGGHLCVCVCVFIKLHITAQSGPVILVILCHSH